MNKYQQKFIDEFYNGKMPRDKDGKRRVEILGKIKNSVTVDFPDFNGANGFEPAHTSTFTIDENICDWSKSILNPEIMSGNLTLWEDRGYNIKFDE